jgi:hypothetical protein
LRSHQTLKRRPVCFGHLLQFTVQGPIDGVPPLSLFARIAIVLDGESGSDTNENDEQLKGKL